MFEFQERLAAHVREVSAPPWIVDGDMLWTIAGRDLEARQVREDPITHERAHAYSAVVSAGHGMADTRIDAPDGELRRQRDGALEFGGLAEKRHQAVLCAADARHLVHHAARCTHDQVLDLLTPNGAHAWRHVQMPRRQHRFHRRGLERGR